MNKLSFRSYRSSKLATACIIAGFAFYASCSQDSGIGRNVLPSSTLTADFIDTTTVVTSLVLEDTVPSNNNTVDLLGYCTDPIFGPSRASIYTQLQLPTDGVNPFTSNGYISSATVNVILDSVIFALPYGSYNDYNYYGTIGAEEVQVYTLDAKTHFVNDSAYYDDAVISHKNLLAEREVTPAFQTNDTAWYPSHPTKVLDYVSSPRMTIKLPLAWGKSWLDTALSQYPRLSPCNSTNINAVNMVSWDTVLERNFPGIYITTASNTMQLPGQGGLWYINPYGGINGIVFYFRVINPASTGTGTDTSYATTNFYSNPGCVSFNHFDHDYSQTVFNGPKNKKDSVYSPNHIYVQAMGGVMTKIDFPYIMNWVKKNKVIINRAEVDIPVDASTIGNFEPPSQLYLIGINDTSTVASTSTFTLPDYGSAYYGGTYDGFNQQYVFDIALYIQNVLDGKTIDHGLYLVAGASSETANRFVGYGGIGNGTSAKRLRLKLYYTPVIDKVKVHKS
ncbi:MAG TPA: DUF4270 family protein [Bacteroidia bacterium]|nr:DUF4270 family protein [Bacteroidia bacterium]